VLFAQRRTRKRNDARDRCYLCRRDIFVAIAAFAERFSTQDNDPAPVAVSFAVTFGVPPLSPRLLPAATSVKAFVTPFVTPRWHLARARSAQCPLRRSPRAAFLDENSPYPEAGSYRFRGQVSAKSGGHLSPQVSAEF
jgi:hypothetical protein